MEKISAVYKIINTITGDFYIGSSKDVKQRWATHKCRSIWSRYPNKQLYQDMNKYGLDKFSFQILEEVEIEQLKEMEQQFIEKLQPVYNNRNANGLDVERHKEWYKEYRKTDKCKEYQKEYGKEYRKTDKCKEYQKQYQKEYGKEYRKTDKSKEYQKQYQLEYENQLCFYNGETLTLATLRTRFRKAGIPHPVIEAKKYLIRR